MSALSTADELAELDAFISAALTQQATENPAVVGLERTSDSPPAWYVRFHGDAKENFSAEMTLRQRSLAFETYFIPAPQENLEAFYRFLLQRNTSLYGMAFAIRDDGGIYIEGRLPNAMLTVDDEIDRILGSLFSYTEEMFAAAARIGFASRFES